MTPSVLQTVYSTENISRFRKPSCFRKITKNNRRQVDHVTKLPGLVPTHFDSVHRTSMFITNAFYGAVRLIRRTWARFQLRDLFFFCILFGQGLSIAQNVKNFMLLSFLCCCIKVKRPFHKAYKTRFQHIKTKKGIDQTMQTYNMINTYMYVFYWLGMFYN